MKYEDFLSSSFGPWDYSFYHWFRPRLETEYNYQKVGLRKTYNSQGNYYTWDLSSNPPLGQDELIVFIRKEFQTMFDTTEFISLQKGKQAIDYFLEKYRRLAVFK